MLTLYLVRSASVEEGAVFSGAAAAGFSVSDIVLELENGMVG